MARVCVYIRLEAEPLLACSTLCAVAVALSLLAGCGAMNGTVTAANAATSGTATHDYEMNEAAGATVMHDTGSVRLDGKIGSAVMTHASFGGDLGYRFPKPPATPPAHPEHLVTVPDSPSLDPGSADYGIEIRYRTSDVGSENLIQKGQGTTAGGQVKLQLQDGEPQCFFRDSSGRTVGAKGTASLANGAWHVLRCTRTTRALDLYVDHVRIAHRSGVTGRLDNGYPLSIGGKSRCGKVSCDYFGGDVDYVRIEKGF
jgi:hypothetical protein